MFSKYHFVFILQTITTGYIGSFESDLFRSCKEYRHDKIYQFGN